MLSNFKKNRTFKRKNLWLQSFVATKEIMLPRLRSRSKLGYDQTQSSAHPCVPRPKLRGLDKSSSALQSGRWCGDGLIRGNFGPKSLTISGFERTWVRSEATSGAIGSDQRSLRAHFGLIS